MEELATWFDPGQKGKIQMTSWRWVYEWLKAILRSPIGPIEQLRCIKEIYRWARDNRSRMKKELKSGIKKMLYQWA
jgi:hypothetical protein